jgi:hypothetical protein
VRDETRKPRWTMVLETERGNVVRADYRQTSSTTESELVWEQEIAGTPFERILHSSRLELGVTPKDDSTRLTLTARQKVRGLSRLGSPMLSRGTGRTLDEALAGVERALETGEAP